MDIMLLSNGTIMCFEDKEMGKSRYFEKRGTVFGYAISTTELKGYIYLNDFS
jgi:hypothetical protein